MNIFSRLLVYVRIYSLLYCTGSVFDDLFGVEFFFPASLRQCSYSEAATKASCAQCLRVERNQFFEWFI